MASFATACRMSVRLTARQLRQDVTARGFRTSASSLAAQNFTMPALSPTMTEGNIAKWNVKEGDSFSAGDVLLEIETDKASMDVEAQDDGILAKIIHGDGSKGIQVGTRIGIIAEEGDDLSSLDIPAEGSAPPPKKESTPETASEEPKQAEASKRPSSSSEAPAHVSSDTAKKQTYPLLPSVEHLIHLHGLDSSAIDKITPTGPNNRLLKGDVLAYLGSISSSYPSEVSSRISKLSHLDLSNIKLAPPVPKPSAPKSEPAPEPIVEDTELAVQISMKAVLDVQKRIQSSLGVFLPISTFINRAIDLANDDLPFPKNCKPTADELFNQILGLDKVLTSKGTRGTFIPQISAFPPTAPARPAKPIDAKKPDILDLLTATKTKSKNVQKLNPGLSSGDNVFSVKVKKGDENRAGVFLERVKVVLEGEPGRLVL